jgi:hypothetical protein
MADESPGSRWESGFVFQPENCIEAEAWNPCGPPPNPKKVYDGNQDPVEYAPFILEVPYTCAAYGFRAVDYEEKALRQIDAAKGKALEYEFWTGSINPSNVNLVHGTPNDDSHVLNPGGAAAPVPVSPGMALVLLSQALANCGTGARGMIHATAGLVERWSQLRYVTDVDGVLQTGGRCDIVVSGSGYPGTGPNGQPPPGPNEVWAYATGMVVVRLGPTLLLPETFSEAFDRRTNTVTYRGEISASAVHDGCCSFAVLVDVCGTD